jgi:hypothetical protein
MRSLVIIQCSHYIYLEIKMGQVTKFFDPFDVEKFIFQNNMRVDVVKMTKPFLQFLKVYYSHRVHHYA